MKNSLSAAAWAWLVLIGLSSFMTWATFKIVIPGNFGGFPNELLGDAAISANAWKSNLTLLGMQIPNWLPVIAAFGAVGALYARNNGADLSPKLPRTLLLYAIAHVALFSCIIFTGGRGSLGIGSLLALLGLGGLWKTIVKTSQVKDFKTPIT